MDGVRHPDLLFVKCSRASPAMLATKGDGRTMTDRFQGLRNRIVGKAKRVFGELTARPDIVLEGEDQQTEGIREERAAGDKRASLPDDPRR